MRRKKRKLNGNGYVGEKTEIDLENFIVYNSWLETEKPLEIEVRGADDWLQFHYQLSGSTSTVLVEKGGTLKIGPNSLNVLYQKRGTCMIHFPENCNYKSFGFRVDPDYFSRSFLSDFKELSSMRKAIENENVFHRDKEYTALDLFTRKIIKSILENPYKGSLEQAFMENKIIELIFHSIPSLRQRPESATGDKAFYREKIKKARSYIEDNLDHRLSLSSVSEYVGVNQYVLKTRFKESNGQRVIEFYIDLKLKMAYDKILNTDEKITSIAYDIGYSSVGNFSNAFFRKFGFRPSQLRK